MIEELVRLLQRQLDAVTEVEVRARTLETAVARNQDRLVRAATDDLEDARDRLAALELARTMMLAASGVPPETSASALCQRVGSGRERSLLRVVVDELQVAVLGAQTATQRAAVAVSAAA